MDDHSNREEDDHPSDESDGVPSFTTAKLTCEEAGNSSKRAFIRVFVQVPYVDTEFEDAETRGRQATRYEPQELIAFEKLDKCDPPVTSTLLGRHQVQQGPKWPVPSGFLLYYAWEVVDGLRLGDENEASGFWRLERPERDLIRAAFQMIQRRCQNKGVWPTDASPHNLLWDSDGQKLLWVNC